METKQEIRVERDLSDGLVLPKPSSNIPTRGRKASATSNTEEGIKRLEGGGFVTYRGHGARDNNSGPVLAVQQKLIELGFLKQGDDDGIFGR